MGDLARERILRGQCPQCGKEAAPYRLCWSCRFQRRLTRGLKRGARLGVLDKTGIGREARWSINKAGDNAEATKRWYKWGTPINLPEDDRRGHARLQNIRVDVEATLIEVIKFIGRPCTVDEILTAWGRLRDKRSAPLSHDLGRIIIAADRRARRNAKRLAIATRQREREAASQ